MSDEPASTTSEQLAPESPSNHDQPQQVLSEDSTNSEELQEKSKSPIEEESAHKTPQDTTKYRPRDLLRGQIAYSEAKAKQTNVLHTLDYYDKRHIFFNRIIKHRKHVQNIVARQLGLSSTDTVHIANWEEWLYGSYNVCVRADLGSSSQTADTQLLIRFALPYKIGEETFPGNADEKVRTEAGTYAWLEQNCPTIPTPHLYGFGLTGDKHFVSIENLPFFTRVFHRVRRALNALLGYEEPTRFVMQRAEPCPISDMSYMLLEYIKPELGEMLSQTWETQRDDPALRTNFYRSLSHIMLSLAKIPLPTIGSFVIDDAGFLRLTNRPLTQEMHQLENENVPLEVPRDMTYTDAGSYANALLSYHNSRLRYQPNAIVDFGDGINQSASLAVMRSIWPGFFQTQYRRQFRFAFRDLHQSNIFVDSKWNITCLIDLEWACSIPLEMVTAPRWLSGEPIDGMSTEGYDTCMKEFGEILAEDQEEACQSSQPSLSSILLETWERGLNALFYNKIQDSFDEKDPNTFEVASFRYWGFETHEFIEERVEDKERYDADLRNAFIA